MRVLRLFQIALLLVALAATSACSQSPGVARSPAKSPGAAIGGLVIDNRSRDTLVDVRVVVIKTRQYVACGYIPPMGSCSTTFPLRRYQGNDIQVLWKRGGNAEGTRAFVVPLPDGHAEGQTLEVVIHIGGADGFNAFMRPS